MRTRFDRAEHLLRLGRREDELDVVRRLLDQLEQRVEARGRDHVRLVDHVDLVPARRGREERLFPQLTEIGRGSCRARVEISVVAVLLKKNNTFIDSNTK